MDSAATQATFCATLVDEWLRGGASHAVIAPGSRSTPLAVALATNPAMTVHVHPDERSASFIALGISRETQFPTIALTTSGTAASELHSAVIEASLSCIPLIICTADRPPELMDVGAPQTIDQTNLYGSAPRWFHDPGVAESSQASTWRPLASRALQTSLGPKPGPVHLNLPFREPLLEAPGELPPARGSGPWQRRWTASHHAPEDGQRLASLFGGNDGVIIAGAGSPANVVELAERLGWPVVADSRSQLPAGLNVVGAGDAILGCESASRQSRPAIVLRVGEQPSSKAVWQWVKQLRSHRVQLTSTGMPWLDSSHDVDLTVSSVNLTGLISEVLAALDSSSSDSWIEPWRLDERAAQAAISAMIAANPLSEPAVARALTAALASNSRLVVSSSMAIRDVDCFAERRSDVAVHSNRGANGIDGVVSTAVGVASASHRPTALLIGDLAFIHDSNGLVGVHDRNIDLFIVVVDNAGGGIFSFLPQKGQLQNDRFEQLFGTPTGVDPAALLKAYGIEVEEAVSGEQILKLANAGGVRAIVVRSDRQKNLEHHYEVNQAVAQAVL